MHTRTFARFLNHLAELTQRRRERLLALRGWLAGLRGVASRYLAQDAGWRRADSTLSADSAFLFSSLPSCEPMSFAGVRCLVETTCGE